RIKGVVKVVENREGKKVPAVVAKLEKLSRDKNELVEKQRKGEVKATTPGSQELWSELQSAVAPWRATTPETAILGKDDAKKFTPEQLVEDLPDVKFIGTQTLFGKIKLAEEKYKLLHQKDCPHGQDGDAQKNAICGLIPRYEEAARSAAEKVLQAEALT
ncbi:unnamed protein product, partial [Amoebophrya sp. A25]